MQKILAGRKVEVSSELKLNMNPMGDYLTLHRFARYFNKFCMFLFCRTHTGDIYRIVRKSKQLVVHYNY